MDYFPKFLHSINFLLTNNMAGFINEWLANLILAFLRMDERQTLQISCSVHIITIFIIFRTFYCLCEQVKGLINISLIVGCISKSTVYTWGRFCVLWWGYWITTTELNFCKLVKWVCFLKIVQCWFLQLKCLILVLFPFIPQTQSLICFWYDLFTLN